MDHSIPTAPPARPRRLPRALTLLTVGALAASGIALGADPASAASGDVNVVDATFTWGFNNYTSPTAGLTVGGVSGNLSAATDVSIRAFTATAGQGELDSTGSGEIDFSGSVQYNNTQGAVSNLFTLTDPRLTIAGGTEGTLTAAVSSATGSNPYFDTTKNGTRVTVATFDVATNLTSPGTVSYTAATPDYLPSTASANGSWPIDFVTLFTGGKAFFYSSGSDPTTASNVAKKPVALTAISATTATPAVSVAPSYPTAGGLDLAVTGTGFAKLNSGVYVGVGPVGLDLAQTSDSAYAANFTDATWLSTASIGAGGAIAANLHVPTSSLSSTGSYAIYTWNAHTHATTASDSITLVPFSYASLADAVVPVQPSTPSPKTASSLALSPTTSKYGSSATLVATVPATATGTVAFARDGVPLGSAAVASGRASLATSATTPVGAHSITATYSGDSAFDASTATSKLTVAKATLSVVVSGKRFAKASKPKVKVTVGTLANGTKVAGKVAVYVGTTKVKTVSVTTKKRVVSVTLPKRYSKSITVKAKFLGGATTVAKTSKTLALKPSK